MPEELSPQQLVAIAGEFSTPVYVYHAERIREQYESLKTAFKTSDTRLFYACKALTNINVLRYIREIGCNIDCSSINEVQLAIHAGFSPSNILYTSNNISFAEIEAAQQLGVNINIDSLSNLEKFGKKYGPRYPVGIRLRPNIMGGGNLKISTGHDKSKFGIPLEQLDKVLDLVAQTGLFIHALHIHTGSEIRDVEIFARGIEVLFGIADKFPDLKVFDFGGGFKVPYHPGETGTDMEKLGKKVAEELKWFEDKYERHVQAWFEPGKYLVSEAGYFITRVNVIKETAGTVFAGIDSGLNHLIRPMFYGAYHGIDNISNPAGRPTAYTVTGNICETDTFAEDRVLPEVREGDLLMFRNAGAYGFEMASNYNSRFRPAEVLVRNGKPVLIRKRDDLSDLLRNIVQAP